jgi:hypothetical protein
VDDLDRLVDEMRRYIEETFADQPELRDWNLEILKYEVDRVRREDAELAGQRGKAH